MARHPFAPFLRLALLALLFPAAARAVDLPDSTTFESFRLANGMEVRLRAVPGAAGVAITLAYGAGNLELPAEQAGLARLLAELQFTSAAGAIPDRTRDDLGSLRPAGWDIRVTDHLAVLTEVATPAQFAGVLLQVATRAGGVQLGDTCFRAGQETVKRELAQRALGDPDLALHYRVRDLALGVEDATTIANARGRGLQGVDRQAAAALLAKLYVPANASLAMVGDFKPQYVRALVERLFGSIAGGSPAVERPETPLQPGVRTSTLPGLRAPVSVIAAFAPSLDDTVHADFYMACLIAAGWWREHAGVPHPPLGSSFRYSPVDEPDLVRFFLSNSPTASSAEAAKTVWLSDMELLRAEPIYEESMKSVRDGVEWLIGGALPAAILHMSRKQTAPLSTISIGTAMRARWRGDDFWNAYRERFMRKTVTPLKPLDWLADPRHSATLTLVPRP